MFLLTRISSTFVNPIGMGNAGWKYLLMYVCWLAFEIVCVYFLFPETKGRTLEELTFCKLLVHLNESCVYHL